VRPPYAMLFGLLYKEKRNKCVPDDIPDWGAESVNSEHTRYGIESMLTSSVLKTGSARPMGKPLR
jgi:hypothetical protein